MTIEEKREKTRLRNIAWRKNDPQKYLRAAAKYRHNHPDKLAEYKLKVRFGLTVEHYNKMMVLQNYCCAICGKEETARHNRSNKIQKLAVDHCHKNGKIRGLLCQDCNRGVGLFQDDPTRLRNAIQYLAKHSMN
jgi:hypothetical protein